MSFLDDSAAGGGGFLDPIAAKIKNPFSTTVSMGGERPQDFPGGFQILEYVDGKAKNDTLIKLIGNMMPMQPFPWEREQRMVKEYYPGNPEAAVQVLGSKQNNLVIHGRFKDKHFKDPGYYGVAYQFAKALEEMTERGNLVKFGMLGMSDNWFRWGFLEKSSFKMNKLSWVDYEISFFIVSDKQPINNYFAAREKNAPGSVNQALLNSAADFNSKYSTIPTSMPQSLGDVMRGIISGVAKNINLVTGFVDTVISAGTDVVAASNRALGLIQHCRTKLFEYSNTIDSVQHTFARFSTQGNNAGKSRDFYTHAAYILETHGAMQILAAHLAQMQSVFEALAKQTPKARYRVVGNDTLQNISIKFYGTADNADAIKTHNKLQSSLLVVGTILEIPKL